MGVLQIAILVLLAAAIGQLRSGRQLAMLAASALVVFWLQPDEPAPSLRFWLPVAMLGITVLAWCVTTAMEARSRRSNWLAVSTLASVLVILEASRYAGLDVFGNMVLPRPEIVLLTLAGVGGLALVLLRSPGLNRLWLALAFSSILLTFVVLKTPGLAGTVQRALSGVLPLPATDAVMPISWLGFSYVAFRLLHTIRDRVSGRLPPLTLAEYANYAIFFPAFTAGPIDRVERFVQELRAPLPLTNEDWMEAGRRLFVGLFKKFVLADLLAVISISDVLAVQVKTSGWLWAFLYAYAFRIYLDFSGYTDIAIGIGRLMGIRLPENFASPYLKSNLTQFWNSWHMSLTQWFRAYVFNPLTRGMRSANRHYPAWLIILVAQFTTMVLIGLWHGVTWGFAAWGLWHGVGLFIHNRWSNFARSRMPTWTQTGAGQTATVVAGVFVTFNYVSLGWLFFSISSPALAWHTLLRLFGAA